MRNELFSVVRATRMTGSQLLTGLGSLRSVDITEWLFLFLPLVPLIVAQQLTVGGAHRAHVDAMLCVVGDQQRILQAVQDGGHEAWVDHRFPPLSVYVRGLYHRTRNRSKRFPQLGP